MKEKFKELLLSTGRYGVAELLEWLEGTDFYSAPASTQYHGAKEGGLLEHSLAVYDALKRVTGAFPETGLSRNEDTLILTGLLHDLCKVNFYKKGFRNRKNEQTGQWEKVEVYEIEDLFPFGHGEKSVIIAQKFIALTKEEMLAIRWHMCGFDDAARQYGGGQALSKAMKDCSLITALHAADLAACHFGGV